MEVRVLPDPHRHKFGYVMEIRGKVHCLFEQSGTFKREFIKLGIPAEDYDIQNNFGQTDHIVDLFKAIEDAYAGQPSIWDGIGTDDLILAFFPCIYFNATSQMLFSFTHKNYCKLSVREKAEQVLKRSGKREQYFRLAVIMIAVAMERGLRLIMENPWSEQTFLKANFVAAPTLIDSNRMLRGDYFMKPTAYWYINCTPTTGMTIQMDKKKKTIIGERGLKGGGICNADRSMISPDYARNFIHDFILGKEQVGSAMSLF